MPTYSAAGKGDDSRIQDKVSFDEGYLGIGDFESNHIISVDKHKNPAKVGYYARIRKGEIIGPFNSWQKAKSEYEKAKKEI